MNLQYLLNFIVRQTKKQQFLTKLVIQLDCKACEVRHELEHVRKTIR